MFKKTLIAGMLALPLTAFATVIPTTFNDSSLGGADNVTFSQLEISGGGSTITVTDADNNGALSVGDTFLESGLIAGVAFLDGSNNPIPDTNLFQSGGYELWAVFNPLVGYVAAVNPITMGLNLVGFTATALFTNPSIVTLYYDTAIGGGFNIGSSTAIGVANQPTANSQCNVSTVLGAESGSCLMSFEFDDAGVTAPGVWTAFGDDIGNLDGVKLRVDLNIDEFNPFFSLTYDEVGGTQEVGITHNGSASFVPEPASLALMGLGLVGLGAIRRRKMAA